MCMFIVSAMSESRQTEVSTLTLMLKITRLIPVFALLATVSAATSTSYLKVEPPQFCWIHTAAGYTPKVTLTTTPTEKLEALSLQVQFHDAGQSAAPLFSLQEDAEANIHYSSILRGNTSLPTLPSSGVPSLTLTARILPYAARNTTTLGKMQAVSLGHLKLGSTVCKS